MLILEKDFEVGDVVVVQNRFICKIVAIKEVNGERVFSCRLNSLISSVRDFREDEVRRGYAED